ncbi:MAG TPA: hypothetical protein P5531_07880 [Bacteroidales bacterium]|nr:hypothetical protein [Bacteroidales bacterium]HSA43444.1 hypothetical protein [Bacteroidales bacterium]
MKLIITDSNVFFDIIKIGALPEFFALDYDIRTTDFVYHEIEQSDQRELIESFIRAKKLYVFSLTSEEVEEVTKFTTIRQFKGLTDKTVLWMAHQLKCMILTGDKKLKREAEDLNIEVHASLWVVEQLIGSGIIHRDYGCQLFERLKLTNTSLPVKEIDRLIKKYKK